MNRTINHDTVLNVLLLAPLFVYVLGCEEYHEDNNVLCKSTEHFFAEQCEVDDVVHCGTHTNDCTKISGWKSGNCIIKKCFADECFTGYHLVSHFESDNIEVQPVKKTLTKRAVRSIQNVE